MAGTSARCRRRAERAAPARPPRRGRQGGGGGPWPSLSQPRWRTTGSGPVLSRRPRRSPLWQPAHGVLDVVGLEVDLPLARRVLERLLPGDATVELLEYVARGRGVIDAH